MVGISTQGEARFLDGSSDTAEFWPIPVQPELHTASLPLDLTCVQLKLLDWVGKGLGAEDRPISPVLARAVQLADHRLALMESTTTGSWRDLPRPVLPFPRPPAPTQRQALRHYTHPRRSRPPFPTAEPLYSSSPPPLYRTADILQLLRTTAALASASANPHKRKRPDDDDDDRHEGRQEADDWAERDDYEEHDDHQENDDENNQEGDDNPDDEDEHDELHDIEQSLQESMGSLLSISPQQAVAIIDEVAARHQELKEEQRRVDAARAQFLFELW